MLSVLGDSNVVPFHLWCRETMLKDKKGLNYFVSGCRSSVIDVVSRIRAGKAPPKQPPST